jgi:hypothetical protein
VLLPLGGLAVSLGPSQGSPAGSLSALVFALLSEGLFLRVFIDTILTRTVTHGGA